METPGKSLKMQIVACVLLYCGLTLEEASLSPETRRAHSDSLKTLFMLSLPPAVINPIIAQ